MNLVITGSVAYDYLMTFPGLFREQILPNQIDSLSLSFLVDGLVRHRGGIATNIAYTLALLGERPRVMATVGQDFADYRTWLEAKGIDTSAIRAIGDLYTASFFATTDRSNSQIASFYAGAMARAAELSLEDLDPRPELVVVSPNDPLAMHKYLDEAAALGVPAFYDPSQQVARVDGAELAHGLAHCAALICNEYEYGLIQKKTGLSSADITRQVDLVVVTLGREGSRIEAQGRSLHIPPVPQDRIVDPTGVGDAFRGGFLKGYLRGLDHERCGRLGSLAATYCLEEQGTQNHHFDRADFLARYEANFGADTKVREILAV